MFIETGNYKSILMTGFQRAGKSFISSVFVADKECLILRRVFSTPGLNFTQCVVKIIVSPEITESYVQFNTESNRQLCSIFEEERLDSLVYKFNRVLKQKRESGEGIVSSEYIKIFVPPSQLAREIIHASNLSYLVIVDTPEDTMLVQMEEINLVMFVFGSRATDINRADSKETIAGLMPLSKDILFLYNGKKLCDNENEYEDMQRDACSAVQCFEEEFTPLIKSSIIPILGVPNMHDRKIIEVEEIFRQRLMEIVKVYFKFQNI
ncbi:MAG: hypothetical protein LBS29_05085 [Endomicrobium sp.]|jgi:hypothetical protein|nr:hypothetical protein [Endomicrobium sp.]